MRGHGVMIPFGLRVPTVSLITHEKVRSPALPSCSPGKPISKIAAAEPDQLVRKGPGLMAVTTVWTALAG